MDESEAVDQQQDEVATPIFSVYRRGYDPEQVDRYVTDQQRRLDEATHRASESERKLAAAVGQLRELHRRVAVYESEQRSAQPPALDSLGERVQRILQEAWEGAYNLRQEAEREVGETRESLRRELEAEREQCHRDIEELRQVASAEAAELVDEATKRALALRDEMDRRRQAYLERVERDRQRAVSQISFLYDQRQLALGELVRLQATVEATVEEMMRSPLGKPAAEISDEVVENVPAALAAPAGPAVATFVAETPAEPFPEPVMGAYSEPVAQAYSEPADGFEPMVGDETGEYDVRAELVAEDEAPVQASPEVPAEPAVFDYGASPQAEIPTGPIDAVDYGYGYQTSEPAELTEPAEPVETIADPTGPWSIADGDAAGDWVPEPEPGGRHLQGSVFDGEAEGWS